MKHKVLLFLLQMLKKKKVNNNKAIKIMLKVKRFNTNKFFMAPVVSQANKASTEPSWFAETKSSSIETTCLYRLSTFSIPRCHQGLPSRNNKGYCNGSYQPKLLWIWWVSSLRSKTMTSRGLDSIDRLFFNLYCSHLRNRRCVKNSMIQFRITLDLYP